MKKNLLYTFLLAALATSCTDDSFLKHGGSNEAGGSGNGSRVYIQNFMQEPDSVDVQGLLTRGVAETTPDANGICQAEWFTTKEEEIDIYELGDDNKFTYFTTAKLHPESTVGNHEWAGYDSWFGETMDYVDYKPGHKYIAVCGTKAVLNYNRDTFDPYHPTLNMAGQRSYPQDNETVNLDYDFMVSNLVEAGKDEKGVMSSQPDFHFNHVASLVKYNLYNLPADKKITKIIVSSPASSFVPYLGSDEQGWSLADFSIPLGFHVIAPFAFTWDASHPNEYNIAQNQSEMMSYYKSETAPLEILVCDENETVGREPVPVPDDDKYADYNTKLTTTFFATEALFNNQTERRTDALVVRAIADDGSSYVCVTSEEGDAYLSGYSYTRNLVMRPDNVTLAQTSGFVDLGLPSGTLWDAVNLGALSPEESGDYLAWGEVATKTSYTYSNYKLKSKYLISDNKPLLERTDDVFENMNPNISLPTQEQIRELVFKCRWERVYYKGTVGSLVTGPNGNQIFIPYAGYKDGSETLYQSNYAYLWSKSLLGFITGNDDYAGVLRAYDDGGRNNYSMQKYIGCSVRCVGTKKIVKSNGYEYVDLGLPSHTYWATMNVGANSPEEPGGLFQYAGLDDVTERTKTNFNDAPYQTNESASSRNETVWSKYTKKGETLEPMDDVAHVRWGGDWRIPTWAEILELQDNCYLETTKNYNGTGKSGLIVYKAKNSSHIMTGLLLLHVNGYTLSDIHIFLPANNIGNGYSGSTVSQSLSESPRNSCANFEWNQDYFYPSGNGGWRWERFSVRPVIQ